MLSLFVTLLALMPSQTSVGAYVGVGGVSCTEWISRGSVMATKLEQESWVLGYASGVNAVSSADFLQKADAPAMLLFVDTYCAKNTDKKLIDAANELLKTLKSKTP